MKTMLKTILISLTTAGLVVGCASSPDVPEKTEKRSYRSTEGAGSAGEGSASESDGQAQTNGSQQSAPGDGKTTPRGTGGIPEASGPVATVNGEKVPAKEFNTEMTRIANSGQFPQQVLPQFADKIVESLVNKRLIEDAIETADIDVEDKAIDKRVDRLKQEYAAMSKAQGGNGDGALDKMLEQMNITEGEFRDSVAESLRMERLLEQRGMELPGEEEARKFYEDNKSQFQRKEQVRARHILIKVPSDAADKKWEEAFSKIEKIRAEAVADDADFAKIAKKRSEGPSAKRGGDLGYFGKGQMVPEFENTVFGLDKGEVSEPVKTQFGWHIIKLIDKREAGPVPFDKVSDRLTMKLKNEAIQNSVQELVAELRKDAEIELHLENIE